MVSVSTVTDRWMESDWADKGRISPWQIAMTANKYVSSANVTSSTDKILPGRKWFQSLDSAIPPRPAHWSPWSRNLDPPDWWSIAK
jgi:hypothetical protein